MALKCYGFGNADHATLGVSWGTRPSKLYHLDLESLNSKLNQRDTSREKETIHNRADHRRPERSRRRHAGQRTLLKIRHERSHAL